MATRRAKRFDDGGVVSNSNYPFGQSQGASAAPTSTGLGNNSPLVQVTNTGTPSSADVAPIQMKKGGAVRSKSRGDGIAQRGKTRGRIV